MPPNIRRKIPEVPLRGRNVKSSDTGLGALTNMTDVYSWMGRQGRTPVRRRGSAAHLFALLWAWVYGIFTRERHIGEESLLMVTIATQLHKLQKRLNWFHFAVNTYIFFRKFQLKQTPPPTPSFPLKFAIRYTCPHKSTKIHRQSMSVTILHPFASWVANV